MALADARPAAEQVDSAVRGVGASPGMYRGAARIVRAFEELERVAPGDVLICQVSSPAWTAAFARAGAVVADRGGTLSHPAILARELGIPAVVGAGIATQRIPDGAYVEVDGTTGVVRWGLRNSRH